MHSHKQFITTFWQSNAKHDHHQHDRRNKEV
jgi:hypothetical protein